MSLPRGPSTVGRDGEEVPVHDARTRVAVAAAVCLCAALVGCAPPDRAGGHAGAATHTLVFAQPNISTPPELVAWAEEVQRLSDGSLTIDYHDGWREGEPRYEQGVIDNIRRGNADLGWVGARVFDRVGYDAFQALLAPFLVDSFALESKVFAEGIPDQMAEGLGSIGLVGVGVLPGGLRRMLGRRTAFTTASSFRGSRI